MRSVVPCPSRLYAPTATPADAPTAAPPRVPITAASEATPPARHNPPTEVPLAPGTEVPIARVGYAAGAYRSTVSIPPASSQEGGRTLSYAFLLTIPFEPTIKTVEIDQSNQSDQGPITLERISITPTETRIYLRGLQLAVEGAVFELNAAGRSSTQGGGARTCERESRDDTVCRIGFPLLQQRGEWRLRLLGQWGFEFTVP